MKTLIAPFAVILALFLAFSTSCNNKEMEKLKAENDSLKNVVNESTNQVDQYLAAFNKIQENLNTIKQKEHIIDINTKDSSEITPDVEESINNDINTIYSLMQENTQALITLKKQLRQSGIKNKQLEATISNYEKMLKQKDEEITQLTQKLQQMNINLQQMQQQMTEMQNNIDTLTQIQQQQNQTINQQDQMLHQVYYVVGTKDELINHSILTKNGLLSKLSIDPNFDKSYFTTADDRQIEIIPINSKKIKILTTHPENSYTLVKDKNNVIVSLKITDKTSFWNASKFCVILIK